MKFVLKEEAVGVITPRRTSWFKTWSLQRMPPLLILGIEIQQSLEFQSFDLL